MPQAKDISNASAVNSSQWRQLILLALIHFWADLYVGMVPSLMPAIRSSFGISVMMGVLLMTIPIMVVNLIQVLVGHTRSRQTFPLLIYVGGCLAVCGSGLSLVVGWSGSLAFGVILTLFSLSAVGVGLVHPESFRAVHALTFISPAIGTAVFMIGGQLGYGLGAWIATILVARWNFPGLWSLVPVMAILLLLAGLARIRLAVESDHPSVSVQNSRSISFWPLWIMNLPAAFCVLAFLNLLPQYLNQLGYELEFGGYANWLFMGGSVVGCLFWSALSQRWHPILCIVLSLTIGAPIFAIYAHWADHRQAVWLLCGAGFCLMAVFTLVVKEARFAQGLNLGARMAISAGGTWGAANLGFMILSYIIKEIWSETALIHIGIHYSWLMCLPSILLGLWILKAAPGRN